jgi:transposase InsO family protein
MQRRPAPLDPQSDPRWRWRSRCAGSWPRRSFCTPTAAVRYTSAQLAQFADRHNLARSVGRTGQCWDNAAAESFWATLQIEFYDRYLWPTRAAAWLAVGDWIERVYNRRRRHSALGYDQPGRIRRPIHSDGTSRLTLCPPNGVKPTSGESSIRRGAPRPRNRQQTAVGGIANV